MVKKTFAGKFFKYRHYYTIVAWRVCMDFSNSGGCIHPLCGIKLGDSTLPHTHMPMILQPVCDAERVRV